MTRTTMRRPPFLIASMLGDTAKVQRLLEQQEPAVDDDVGNSKGSDNFNNDSLVNTQDIYGWTALLLASINGHVETVRYLLSKGANINHENNFGNTAIMCAGKRGHFPVVRLLLNHGANVSYQCISAQTLTTTAAAMAASAVNSRKECKMAMDDNHNNGTRGTIGQHSGALEETKKRKNQEIDTTLIYSLIIKNMQRMMLQKDPALCKSLETFLHDEHYTTTRHVNIVQTELLQKGLAKSVLLHKGIVSLSTATASHVYQEQQQRQQDTNQTIIK